MEDYKIYVSGPLFNAKEREENQEIANVLEKAGFETYLPQRDGLLFTDIVGELRIEEVPRARERAERAVMKLIAHYDVYNAATCDGFLLNLNGRVPDEGALVEGAISFAKRKPVVAYKSDGRSLIQGHDNPLVSILSYFKVVDSINLIPGEFRMLKKQKGSTIEKVIRASKRMFKKDRYTEKELADLALKHFLG